MEIKKVAFVGSGSIGTGLAINCIMRGIPVTLQTRRQVALCKERIREGLEFFQNNGIINADQFQQALSLASYTTSIEEAVTGAQFIQESGPEKLEIKQELLKEIEKFASPDAIIATSTSGLSISEIFSQCVHPERGIGGHPYLPAYLIPLVEVTKGVSTSEDTAEGAMNFYKEIGKEPVLLNKEITGFIANRFSSAIHREIVHLVMEGVCSVEDVDKALVYSLGIRWATMGQALTLHLSATPEGMRHFTEKYHWVPGTPNKRVAALANWTIFPEGWDKVLADGLDVAIAHRPPETGNDTKSIEAWRDQMLLGILRLHHKL
jgi:carnitine 3-dehydrogenase